MIEQIKESVTCMIQTYQQLGQVITGLNNAIDGVIGIMERLMQIHIELGNHLAEVALKEIIHQNGNILKSKNS